uniref:NADH-ubiquinone oxidoreductase chain 2 n=2 Tax=Zymoseptoria tritici TaxID=1047171 RepID=A9Y5H8_ZYMTI|nr:NADH dehydrogenase subunit 2 [Zymoseptoria tritici]ABU40265.1 NADH dehydrogenase subunit 2 [Zymoseptoria tritici]AYO45626.1 NADH dehydrogenase subunit 2 [Zymoseptoria tritici]
MLILLLINLLVSNALTTRRDKSILFSRIVIKSLLMTSFIAYNNLYLNPLGKGVGIFGGLFNVTTFTQTFSIFILLISAVILTLTAFYPRKVYINKHSSILNILGQDLLYNKSSISNKTGEQYRIIEYPLIIVFIICGALFLISTADLVSIFLSIELQSYGLYILSTLYRNSETATASGLTYFLLGGLSSCFILLGSALLYANSGTTNLENMYVITSISEIKGISTFMYLYQPHYFHLSLIIMSVGFLFKVSAAPFHFWSPDVYDGIPTIVTTYVAIVAKISIFAFLLELIYYTEQNYLDFSWKSIFIYSSLFSLIIGSVLGLTQFRIKRLFAYSTISHVGFILLALAINSTESIQSYIFYILQYSVSNLNAFIILVTMGFSFYLYVNKEESKEDLYNIVATEKNNSPIQLISQIKGYFYINPYLAISLAITLFSFVGIPPIIGFFAKQMILSAALDSGYVFMALVAILTSVIGAAYYLNLIKQIFFYKNDHVINPSINNMDLTAYISSKRGSSNGNSGPSYNGANSSNVEKIKFTSSNIVINSSFSSIIAVLTLLLLLFIYIPGEWFNIVSVLTVIIFRA